MRGKFNACAQIRIDRTKKKMKDGIYMEKALVVPVSLRYNAVHDGQCASPVLI